MTYLRVGVHLPRDAPRHSLACSAASVIVLLCHTFVKSGQLCINVHIFIIICSASYQIKYLHFRTMPSLPTCLAVNVGYPHLALLVEPPVEGHGALGQLLVAACAQEPLQARH